MCGPARTERPRMAITEKIDVLRKIPEEPTETCQPLWEKIDPDMSVPQNNLSLDILVEMTHLLTVVATDQTHQYQATISQNSFNAR